MVFGFRARRAETSLRETQARLLGERAKLRMDREDQLAKLRFEAMSALLQQAKAALEAGDLATFNSLSSQAFGPEPVTPAPDLELISLAPSDTLTPHEKLLDGWRVVTTVVLVLALFTIVAIALSTSTAATTASPYVSILSGLAGIALGWMFAGAAGASAIKRSGKGTSRTGARTDRAVTSLSQTSQPEQRNGPHTS
jgi:hypothetical protein